MKHTDRYGVAAIANALTSLQNRISGSSIARRIVSRVGVVARRRFRPAVLLLLLASLFLSSTPSAPNSFARVSADSGITTTLSATVDRLAASLYQGLQNSYASTVNSLPGRNPKAHVSNSDAFVPAPTLVLGAPTNLTVTSVSNTSISLSWTSPGGTVDHYLVERSQSSQGPFTIIAIPATTNHPDNTVSGGNAYLYRVRAVDGFGAASAPSTMAVGTAISFADATLIAGTTEIKKQHIYDLRQAVNAVRALAGLGAITWTNADLTGLEVKALHVQQLRDKLDEALVALNVPVTAYQDSTLATGLNGTPIRKIHIEQLRLRSTGGSSTSTGSVSQGGESAVARLDPMNQTGGGGENPLSRNYNLNIPILGLSGRSGLDLGLSLAYNSLVWTKNGSTISFDDDGGFPSPGFRLGFPVIQAPYYNSQAAKNAFLMIGSDGGRTELRQVGSSALYEAADSSYLLLDSNSMILRTTDGTQLLYAWKNFAYQCTEIKDRNGNYITINYNGSGRISTIVDTLGRVITFNYDGTNSLTTITQQWNGVTHEWARFEYIPNGTIQTNFQGLTTIGPQTVRELSKVTLNDGSRYEFDYTVWGQIWKVRNHAANGDVLNYRAYNLPGDQGPQTDCPRFTERHDWAKNWNRALPNGYSGLPAGDEQEVFTASWLAPVSDSWILPDGSPQSGLVARVTQPADGIYNKIYFASTGGSCAGWCRGLQSMIETYDIGNAKQRQSVTLWTQDDVTKAFPMNPRVSETNVYDPAGNRARTTVDYETISVGDGTTCKLPSNVVEFQANATTPLRRTHSEYNKNVPYLGRRIIRLLEERTLIQTDPSTLAETLMSRVGFTYDGPNSIESTVPLTQHYAATYGASFVVGRANLSTVTRYDVTTSASTSSTMKYNTAGSIILSTDPSGHATVISYADAFAANGTTLDAALPVPTLAYPTMVTDADGYTSKGRYNYHVGAPTWKQTPLPNTQQNLPGPETKLAYDVVGRLERVTNLVNNAYKRYEYSSSQNRVDTYATIQENSGEAHSFMIADGYARTIASVSLHPGSTGGFSAQLLLNDKLGRVIKTSNPAETNAPDNENPTQWQPKGEDAPAGWRYTQQTYDWKGRPRLTTNTDDTTKEASYAGCGCAGGQVVTLTDEGSIDGGVPKRRQQKVYEDVLGRTVKSETFNWVGGSVYSTTVNSYNARDQVTLVRKYQGTDGSGVFQDTIMTYDGYGRLRTKHVPEQKVNTQTTYDYNPDDTLATRTDARGASATYLYNGRKLRISQNYTVPSGVPHTPNVAIGYDAAGNRLWMTDGAGRIDYSYDNLSRMQWEERDFADAGTYRITYGYNLSGQLSSVTDPFSSRIDYQHNQVGKVIAATGTGYTDEPNIPISQFASGIKYRASGALQEFNNGDIAARASFKLGYNSREQLTRFEAGGQVTEHSYTPDGLIRDVHDLSYANFTFRNYQFDHVGRLKEAVAAPGPNTVNPYGYVFDYDAWGNTLSRLGNHYYDFVGYSTTYANNRDQKLVYDDDGHPVNDLTPTQTDTKGYDAEGRQAFNREYTYPPQDYWRTNYIYDGDGRQVAAHSFSENSGGTINDTLHYVRSTMLDGQVVSELFSLNWYFPPNWNQIHTRSYVYLNGEMLAIQTYGTDNNPWMLAWVYRNPVTGTNSEISKGFGPYVLNLIDPVGAEVGAEAPPPPAPPEGPPMSSTALGDPNNFGFGCIVNGVETDCNQALGLLNSGAATVTGFYAPGGYGGVPPPGIVGVPEWSNVGTGGDSVWRREMAYHTVHLFMSGNQKNAQPGRPDFVDEKKINECASKLFGVEDTFLDYRPGKSIGYQFFDPNQSGLLGVFDSSRGRFYVEADTTSKTMQQLTAMTGTGRRGGVTVGATDPKNPAHPYIASDWGGSQYGFYAAFVHELGNALGFLTGKFEVDRFGNRSYNDEKIRPTDKQKGDWEGDDDPGVVFEDCVFGHHVDTDEAPPKQKP